MQSDQLVDALKSRMDEKKGLDIQVMDLRTRSAFCDFFLVVTGTSSTHLASLAEEVDRFAHENKISVLGCEGRQGSQWVLVDLDDVIVHLFLAETRELYNLDRLWSEEALQLNRQRHEREPSAFDASNDDIEA